MRILVTGSSGFIGRSTVTSLAVNDFEVVSTVRNAGQFGDIVVGNIHEGTNWGHALHGCDVVVHLAALAHIRRIHASDPLTAYRRVNTLGTINLARQAVRAGVRRFIFVSSIGVNGTETMSGLPFSADSCVVPSSPYAISKFEAELGLKELSREFGLQAVIIRPPLVYGPNAPGNFGSLVRWLSRGVPLPLGSVTENRRSLVAIDNLVDLILTCIHHPAAANKTFLVSDGEDLSTADLITRMRLAMNKRTNLLRVPPALLTFGANLVGLRDIAQSLLGSLQVDMSYTCKTLGWEPPIGVDEGLHRAVPR